MELLRKDKYVLIKKGEEDLTNFTSDLTKHHNDFSEDNVVIDLLEEKNLDTQNVLGFLEISTLHREGKRSFVIANDALSIDELPEDLVVVPTLREAEDIIQMEELERELGF